MKNLFLFGALTLVLAGCDSAPSDVAMANTATGDGDTTNATNSASTSTLNVASENTPADLASNTPPDETTGLSTDTGQGTTPPTAPPAPPTADGTVGAKAGDDVAVLETTQGRIVFAFLPAKAPKHVENFKTLTKKGFYNGTAFHRVIPGFMIQGGDPNSKKGATGGPMGTGGPGYGVKAEFNDTPHVRGVVSMARSSDPDSAGSQFYIVVKDSNFLDNQYTAFGRVLSGMEVADKLVGLDRDQDDKPTDIEKARVKTVRIAKWPVK